jgi:serine phosphatase RsbU (regulator of sigma subunit)
MRNIISSYPDHHRHLPFCTPRIPGVECFGESFRGDVPGGDFFSVVAPDQHELMVTLGTLPGRALVGALQATFRALGSCNLAVPVIMAELNRVLWEDAPQQTIGCLFIARVCPRLGRLDYVSAGDQLVLMLHAAGFMERLDCNAPPLGLARRNSFRQQSANFAAGDTLIAVTEGAETGVAVTLRDMARVRIREIPSRILDAVNEEESEHGTSDRTVLVIHREGADSSHPALAA